MSEVIVLDTHIWLWFINANLDKIPSHWLTQIEAASQVGVSPVSCYEVALAHNRGRIELPFARKRYPASQVRPQGIDIQASVPDPLVVQSCQVSETRITERKPGLHPGAFIVHDDFDEPLPDSFWLGEA